MERKYEWKSEYFYGNKISEYGLQQGYLDYATLAKAFSAVMVNDITKLFYTDINGECSEPEQENGHVDYSDEIDELQDRIDELMEINDDLRYSDKIEELQDRIDELEEAQDNEPEIYQYFIVSSNGADIIKEFTDDPLYYLPVLGRYIWGVTHWGTSWDYVLTDVKLNLNK